MQSIQNCLNQQLKQLKPEIKNGTVNGNLTSKNGNLTSNLIDDFNERPNFPQKLLLTNRQVSRLCKAFVNH